MNDDAAAPSGLVEVRAALPSEFAPIRQFLVANGWAHRIRDEAWFAELLARSRAVVALDAGQVVGFARGVTDGLSNGYLSMVVVAHSHRRRGVGARLVREVMGGHPDVTWLLRAERPGAREFFEALGFSPSAAAMQRLRRQQSQE
jgi:ribosomal protein S18 acetylase RimI-like enzyme